MFEALFTNGGTIDRYRGAPLLEERLSYLLHCAEAGARLPTLRKIAAHQTSLVHFLDLHSIATNGMDASPTDVRRPRDQVDPRGPTAS